jgi:hypothetical protein
MAEIPGVMYTPPGGARWKWRNFLLKPPFDAGVFALHGTFEEGSLFH